MVTRRRSVISGLLILFLLVSIAIVRGTTGQTVSFRVIGPGIVVVGESVYHLDISNAPLGWHKLPEGTWTLPPIPASSLVDYESGVLAITDSGEGWGKVGSGWSDLGPIPGLTPTIHESWGQLKAKYAR